MPKNKLKYITKIALKNIRYFQNKNFQYQLNDINLFIILPLINGWEKDENLVRIQSKTLQENINEKCYRI